MTTKFIRCCSPLLMLGLLAATPVKTASPAESVRGDYLEARTASVFAGACHYNGERVTEGRSAILAWRITGGAAGGVDLAGVKVAAAIGSEDNLAETAAVRKSELVVDATTDKQADAAVNWVKQTLGDKLGQVVCVKRQPITFRHDAGEFNVKVGSLAAMDVQPMPDAACCSQPFLVWYQPLMPIEGRRVGYTKAARYTGQAGVAWDRSDENSAFYGTFGGKAETTVAVAGR